MNVVGSMVDVVGSAGLAEQLVRRAGVIEGMADELATVVRGAAEAGAAGTTDTLVQRMNTAARASDALIMRAESELDEVRRGAAQLGLDQPQAVALDPVLGITLIPDNMTSDMRESLASAIINAAPGADVRAGLLPDAFIRPGVPLESARQVGQPLALVVTPKLNLIGKQNGATVRAVADNYPVGELLGHSTIQDAMSEARQIAVNNDGIVLIRDSGNAEGKRYFLHFTKDRLGVSEGGVIGSKNEFLQIKDSDIVRYVTPEGPAQTPDYSSKYGDMVKVRTPAELSTLEAIVAGAKAGPPVETFVDEAVDGFDQVVNLPDRLEAAHAAVDGMRAERTALREHRTQAAAIERGLDRTVGAGDRYAWETEPLFASHAQSLLATDLVASSSDPNVAIAALRSEPDGTYAVLVDSAGNFESFRIPQVSAQQIASGSHSDMRAIVTVKGGNLRSVQAVAHGSRDTLFGAGISTRLAGQVFPLANIKFSAATEQIESLTSASREELVDDLKRLLKTDGTNGAFMVGIDNVTDQPFAVRLGFDPTKDAKYHHPSTAHPWRANILDKIDASYDLSDTSLVFRQDDLIREWSGVVGT